MAVAVAEADAEADTEAEAPLNQSKRCRKVNKLSEIRGDEFRFPTKKTWSKRTFYRTVAITT